MAQGCAGGSAGDGALPVKRLHPANCICVQCEDDERRETAMRQRAVTNAIKTLTARGYVVISANGGDGAGPVKAPAYGRVRCEWCNRVLTWREFLVGLAHGGESGNPLEPDVFEHTYDCENEPRRATEPGGSPE
jgi:hypothetical protein